MFEREINLSDGAEGWYIFLPSYFYLVYQLICIFGFGKAPCNGHPWRARGAAGSRVDSHQRSRRPAELDWNWFFLESPLALVRNAGEVTDAQSVLVIRVHFGDLKYLIMGTLPHEEAQCHSFCYFGLGRHGPPRESDSLNSFTPWSTKDLVSLSLFL